jgi:NAD+ kinase
MFNRIGIFGKYTGEQCWKNIELLVDYLVDRSKTVYLDKVSCEKFPKHPNAPLVERDILKTQIDLAIMVGGDGTFLDLARSVADNDVPILGVNLGRLGFLTDVSPENMIATMEEVFSGVYLEEERNILKVTIFDDDKQVFESIAVNDVVIHKLDSPRMIEFETFVDGRFLNSQRSDGMIISTPTGSTAYALSAGGPIIDPSLSAVTLVSINPHTMSTRPYVISSKSEVELRPHETCDKVSQIICDGQITYNISPNFVTRITGNTRPLRLLHPKDHDHFELLRAKLHWGDKLS